MFLADILYVFVLN